MAQQQRPTDAELEILQILWREGPCTVRHVNDVLSARKDVGYTTTLKIMQIMTEKNLVKRNTKERTHIYTASVGEQTVQKRALQKVINTAFQGSATRLILQALGNHQSSPEELEEIKALIKKIESGK